MTVVIGLLIVGALAGIVWQALWTAPTGVALEGRFVLDGPGTRSAFDDTGLFVIISAAVGLVCGVLVGWTTSRDELLVLGVALVGAAGATVLMYVVGHALGPPDPAPFATGAEDYTPLDEQLALEGRAAWLVLTSGLLAGMVVTMLGFGRRPIGEDGTPDPGRLDWRGEYDGPTAPAPVDSLGSTAPGGPHAAPPGRR